MQNGLYVYAYTYIIYVCRGADMLSQSWFWLAFGWLWFGLGGGYLEGRWKSFLEKSAGKISCKGLLESSPGKPRRLSRGVGMLS